MNYRTLRNKRIVVVGLGRSGVAAARFLAKQGARVTVTDRAAADTLADSLAALAGLDVQLRLGGHVHDDFSAAELVVLSPGVPHTLPLLDAVRARGIAVIGEMELAAGFIAEPILAITGTNGKTTTTEMVAAMLRSSGKHVFVGGNIGTPLVVHADEGDERVDVVVAEVSSFQLDTCVGFRPDIAVLLNITDDHLDRYDSFEAYAQSKWRIFANQRSTDAAIVNAMDPAAAGLMDSHPLRARRQCIADWAIRDGARIAADRIVLVDHGRESAEFSLEKSALLGPHNRENTAAACLAAHQAGATDAGIQQTIDGFTGLAHRLETVGWVHGVRFVNDSKATNTDAVKRALECFDRPVALIMGGRSKQGDFLSLRSHVRRHVKTLVAMGEAKPEIVAALVAAPQQDLVEADTLPEAVAKAFAAAAPGETVLLSPACASFDMFDSYAHRGNQFREIVEGLR